MGAGSVVENFPQPIQGKTRDQIGKLFGVSGKSIDYATKVIKNAEPEVIEEGEDVIEAA